MLKINHRYAHSLLEYAEEYGIDKVYLETLQYMLSGAENEPPVLLGEFLSHIPGGKKEIEGVLYAFLDLAREQMNLMNAEVISAVPLRPEQIAEVERRLVVMFHKQIKIVATVDPSLLGGLRIIVDDKVLDDTIKRKLLDMKTAIYEGVYSSL
jgi:F0F1-type ATP synthase delta subunit